MSVNDASRIVTDDSRVMLQIMVSLTDDYRGVIYHRNVLIVWATDHPMIEAKQRNFSFS